MVDTTELSCVVHIEEDAGGSNCAKNCIARGQLRHSYSSWREVCDANERALLAKSRRDIPRTEHEDMPAQTLILREHNSNLHPYYIVIREHWPPHGQARSARSARSAALCLRGRPSLPRPHSIPTAVHALREVAPVQVGGADQVHARSQCAERQGVPGLGSGLGSGSGSGLG